MNITDTTHIARIATRIVALGLFTGAVTMNAAYANGVHEQSDYVESATDAPRQVRGVAPQYAFNVSYGQGSITDEAAIGQRLSGDDSYWSLGFDMYRGAVGHNGSLVLGFNYATYNFDDNAGFSQQVQNTYTGNLDTLRSEANLSALSIHAGARFLLSPSVSIEGLVGLEKLFDGSREIEQCYNCASSEFELEGGTYVMPRLNLTFSHVLGIGMFYKNYLSGDLEPQAGVALSLGF